MAIGRQAWITSATPTMPGKAPHELVFDAKSGVILSMRTGDSYLGFEELELDEEIPIETFRWDGPVEARKVGQALVVPEDHGSYSVHWEVSVRGRGMFDQQDRPGPQRTKRWPGARSTPLVPSFAASRPRVDLECTSSR